jgi:hypothetical protein
MLVCFFYLDATGRSIRVAGFWALERRFERDHIALMASLSASERLPKETPMRAPRETERGPDP